MSEAKKEMEEQPASSSAASQGAGTGSEGAQSSSSAGAAGQAAEVKSETIPRAMYEKLQGDLENFKRIEDERKTKEKRRQEELLKEQGKFKELYETAQKEVETMKARLEKMEGAVKSMLEEETKDLPEEFDKSLIPEVDDYDKVLWLRKAKAAFVKKPEPKRGDGTPPVGGGANDFGTMRSIYSHPTSPKR